MLEQYQFGFYRSWLTAFYCLAHHNPPCLGKCRTVGGNETLLINPREHAKAFQCPVNQQSMQFVETTCFAFLHMDWKADVHLRLLLNNELYASSSSSYIRLLIFMTGKNAVGIPIHSRKIDITM